MKKKIFSVMLAVLLIFMGIPLNFAVQYKTASVVEVTGVVSILKAGGEKVFTPEVDTVLEHGDRIITGKGASIALKIDSDKYIKVGEKTYMSLSELMSEAESGGDSTNIKLFTGKVWASLSKPLTGDDSFEIETPTAVMGAKGTKFYVKYVISPTPDQDEKGSTELVVLEGKVGMKTQIVKQGEGDVQPVTQDVELLANANETLLLDPELVQGISDEIASRLNSGETIDQINIQDVVNKVGKAKQIEVENLDLFVLEIVADEPDAYDPAITEGIEQLIEQKKQELPVEEESEEIINKIIYDKISDSGETKAPSTPAVPSNPTGPSNPTAPSDGGSSKEENTKLEVTKVEVFDTIGDDGIADHIAITFNQDIDDSTYVTSSGAYIESQGTLGDIDLSKISTDSISGITNKTDDSVLIFNLDTTEQSVNTVPIGYFNIPHTGMIRALNGESLGTVTHLVTIDKIAPVLMGSVISLEGKAKDKSIKLIYSEPLKNVSTDFWNHIRVASSAEIMYSDAQTIGYETTSSASIYVEAHNLDYPTVKYIRDAALDHYSDIRLKTSSVEPVYVYDAFGNRRLLQNDIGSIEFAMDTQKAMVSDVVVQTLTANTDYLVTIKLDDYLPAEEVAAVIDNPESFLQGDFSNANVAFVDAQYLYNSTNQININFHVTVVEGALTNRDSFTIDYSALYDMFGYSVTDYFDDAEQTSRVYLYDLSEDKWLMDMAQGSDLFVTSVATLDEDGNGVVDHLQLTFNEPVDDSTFVSANGIFLDSGNIMNPVNDVAIVTDLSGEYVDTADDAILYLELDAEKRMTMISEVSYPMYNTGAVGTFTMPSRTIKSLEGVWNDGVSEMMTLDHASPVIVAATYDLEGTADDKYIKLISSEPLDMSNFGMPDFRILNDNTSTHMEAYPVAFRTMEVNQGAYSSEQELLRLDDETINRVLSYSGQSETIYLYYNEGLKIIDNSGNQTTLTGHKTLLTGSALDSGKTIVKSVNVEELDSNQCKISLIFDDYLDEESLTALVAGLKNAIVYSGGSLSIVNMPYYESDVLKDIEFSCVVQLEAPVSETEQFTIDIFNLYDYKGDQTLAVNENVDRTRFSIVYESGWKMDSPYLDLIEANTVDSDQNGKIDLIELVFNKAVDDSSFMDVSAVVNSSSFSPEDVATNVMVTSSIDIPNDTKIYFSVSEGALENTSAEGTLDIPSPGMITSIYGNQLASINGTHVNDKAAPVLLSASIDLESPYDEKQIELTFTETLDEAQVIDLDKIKLLGSGPSASGPLSLVGNASIIGNQIIINPDLGNNTDQKASFISELSAYLYDATVQIRLMDGFMVKDVNNVAFALPVETTYPYDVPVIEPVLRINEMTLVSNVVQSTSGCSIQVTCSDYIESWNAFEDRYIPAQIYVLQGNFSIMSQQVLADHKTLEIEICTTPVSGDLISIEGVRNITNSYYDEFYESPIMTFLEILEFDGTEWQLMGY